MVIQYQIERLVQRIEGMAARQHPLAPVEHWYVDEGTARCAATGEDSRTRIGGAPLCGEDADRSRLR